MKNLVYFCCFLNKNYTRFFELLFASVALFSKESLKTTDFLVITQEDFVSEIEQSAKKYGIPLFIQLHEKPHNIFISTILRYEIFKWSKLNEYEKALYLDTDILIHGELNTVFDLAKDPTTLYTFREGPISHIYWGGDEIFDFQGVDKEIDPTTQGFCTGVLLFFINKKNLFTFEIGKEYMHKKLQIPGTKIPICYDQPYMNYVCVKYKLNENDSLIKKCINRAFEIQEGYIVYHFPATMYSQKFRNMVLMLTEMIKSTQQSSLKDLVSESIESQSEFLFTYDDHSDTFKKF